MKKMVFIAGALMLLAAGSAMAGSNLAWNDCLGTGGVVDRTAACINTGAGTLYASFVSPAAIPSIAATDVKIDVQTSGTVANWWMPAVTSARWGSAAGLSLSGLCPGWYDGALSGPIVFAPTVQGLTSSRIRVILDAVIAAGQEQPATAGQEYLSGTLILKNSVGTLNNPECLQGGALGITSFNISQPGQQDISLKAPEVTNCCTFRGGGGQTCPAATPTKKATWGSIKALYR